MTSAYTCLRCHSSNEACWIIEQRMKTAPPIRIWLRELCPYSFLKGTLWSSWPLEVLCFNQPVTALLVPCKSTLSVLSMTPQGFPNQQSDKHGHFLRCLNRWAVRREWTLNPFCGNNWLQQRQGFSGETVRKCCMLSPFVWFCDSKAFHPVFERAHSRVYAFIFRRVVWSTEPLANPASSIQTCQRSNTGESTLCSLSWGSLFQNNILSVGQAT